jgi:hypothetical protein
MLRTVMVFTGLPYVLAGIFLGLEFYSNDTTKMNRLVGVLVQNDIGQADLAHPYLMLVMCISLALLAFGLYYIRRYMYIWTFRGTFMQVFGACSIVYGFALLTISLGIQNVEVLQMGIYSQPLLLFLFGSKIISLGLRGKWKQVYSLFNLLRRKA